MLKKEQSPVFGMQSIFGCPSSSETTTSGHPKQTYMVSKAFLNFKFSFIFKKMMSCSFVVVFLQCLCQGCDCRYFHLQVAGPIPHTVPSRCLKLFFPEKIHSTKSSNPFNPEYTKSSGILPDTCMRDAAADRKAKPSNTVYLAFSSLIRFCSGTESEKQN